MPFAFVGVWPHPSSGDTYPECVRNSLAGHLAVFDQRNVVVAGDFNSSPAFASSTRRFTHLDLVNWIHERLGLVSAWHAFTGEAPGSESVPTYYHRFKRGEPFHIDYVFLPERWLPALTHVEIGTYDDWTASDHRPVVVEIDVARLPHPAR